VSLLFLMLPVPEWHQFLMLYVISNPTDEHE